MFRFFTNQAGTPLLSSFLHSLRAYRRQLMESASLEQLTPSELEVLLCLSEGSGGNAAGEIARYLRLSKSMVSHAVDALAELGYVLAEPSPADRRRVTLRLSPAGAAAAERTYRLLEEFRGVISAEISAEDMGVFQRVLAQMTENMDAAMAAGDSKAPAKTKDQYTPQKGWFYEMARGIKT